MGVRGGASVEGSQPPARPFCRSCTAADRATWSCEKGPREVSATAADAEVCYDDSPACAFRCAPSRIDLVVAACEWLYGSRGSVRSIGKAVDAAHPRHFSRSVPQVCAAALAVLLLASCSASGATTATPTVTVTVTATPAPAPTVTASPAPRKVSDSVSSLDAWFACSLVARHSWGVGVPAADDGWTAYEEGVNVTVNPSGGYHVVVGVTPAGAPYGDQDECNVAGSLGAPIVDEKGWIDLG